MQPIPSILQPFLPLLRAIVCLRLSFSPSLVFYIQSFTLNAWGWYRPHHSHHHSAHPGVKQGNHSVWEIRTSYRLIFFSLNPFFLFTFHSSDWNCSCQVMTNSSRGETWQVTWPLSLIFLQWFEPWKQLNRNYCYNYLFFYTQLFRCTF